MNQTETITLKATHPSGSYNIYIGADLLKDTATLGNTDGAQLVIISDENVAPLYGSTIGASEVVTVPPGEKFKNLRTVTGLMRRMVESGLDRSGCIVTLGGGVIGDMGGFTAATYMRGVDLVQCPTSLLAMVDASVGGKTGVDLREGKNLVGAFKQPLAVIIDLETLRSLPADEFASGMAEIVKAGLIADPALFERLESGTEEWSPNAPIDQLQTLVAAAVEMKRKVVEEDPYEHGIRALLNLGHTFGHAIEHVSEYKVKHGFAVAMGCVVAGRVSAELNHCSPDLPNRIEQTFERVGLPTRIPSNLDIEAIIATMSSDKKKKRGVVRYILIRDVGDCFMTPDVPTELIARTLKELAVAEPIAQEPVELKPIYYKQLSKKISQALRHNPRRFDLALDEEGWVDLAALIDALRKRREDWKHLAASDIERMNAKAIKQRYEIKDGKIRALYGHSVKQKIEKVAVAPPAVLYHGTAPKVVGLIQKDGLRPMKRQYVHLSADTETATIVGKRKSPQPVILTIDAQAAHADGIAFYEELNDIWLADSIPAKYIAVNEAAG